MHGSVDALEFGGVFQDQKTLVGELLCDLLDDRVAEHGLATGGRSCYHDVSTLCDGLLNIRPLPSPAVEANVNRVAGQGNDRLAHRRFVSRAVPTIQMTASARKGCSSFGSADAEDIAYHQRIGLLGVVEAVRQ